MSKIPPKPPYINISTNEHTNEVSVSYHKTNYNFTAQTSFCDLTPEELEQAVYLQLKQTTFQPAKALLKLWDKSLPKPIHSGRFLTSRDFLINDQLYYITIETSDCLGMPSYEVLTWKRNTKTALIDEPEVFIVDRSAAYEDLVEALAYLKVKLCFLQELETNPSN